MIGALAVLSDASRLKCGKVSTAKDAKIAERIDQQAIADQLMRLEPEMTR